MENNFVHNVPIMDKPNKPRIHCCGIKIETAVKIAIIFGILLWTAYCTIIFFADKFFGFAFWIFAFFAYCPIIMFTQTRQLFGKNKDGIIVGIICWLIVMIPLIGVLIVQPGIFIIRELLRTSCDSSGQCPGWSSRCPKNFALIAFEANEPNCGKDICPNLGVVERVFEGPENLRPLKRKILEMTATHTNLITMANETMLELNLKPYFDINDDDNDTFDSLEEKEANCELKLKKYKRKILCEEKMAKLKKAFMDIYWAQVKKQRFKMNSTFGNQDGQIMEDEIDAIFVVPYECQPLRLALAFYIGYIISHIAILAVFIRAIPYFNWLDYATTCPVKCYTYRRYPPSAENEEPCEHCPIRMMMQMGRNGQQVEENRDQSFLHSAVANFL